MTGDISLLEDDSLYCQELKPPLYNNSEDCQGWSDGWLAAADAKIPAGDDNSSWLTGEEGIVAGSSSNAALGDSAMGSGMEARTLISEMPRDREEGGEKTTGEEMEREAAGGNLHSSVRPFLNRPPRYPEMEVTEIILAKISRLCQLSSHSRGFLSRLYIFNP